MSDIVTTVNLVYSECVAETEDNVIHSASNLINLMLAIN